MKLFQVRIYPCGYKSVDKFESGLFDIGRIKTDPDGDQCPLHGKDCPNKEKTEELPQPPRPGSY